jgi:hypothetical protein
VYNSGLLYRSCFKSSESPKISFFRHHVGYVLSIHELLDLLILQTGKQKANHPKTLSLIEKKKPLTYRVLLYNRRRNKFVKNKPILLY